VRPRSKATAASGDLVDRTDWLTRAFRFATSCCSQGCRDEGRDVAGLTLHADRALQSDLRPRRYPFAHQSLFSDRKVCLGSLAQVGCAMSQDQHHDRRGAMDASAREVVVPTVPDDLVAMLDLLAQTIVQALGFGVAAVNIARPDGSLEVISVAGDEQARKTLLGTVYSAEIWDQILGVSEPWGRLRFADHRNEEANPDLLSWIPDVIPLQVDDAWHPQDALFAPLIAEDGSRLGILSVDLPQDGRRPNSATCDALGAFAVSAALAIEHATLRSRAESSERALQQLAKQDSLTGVGNRSMLFERLHRAAGASVGHRPLLALAFLDLDGFKVINDRHTHNVGDHILQVVARRIRHAVRPDDTVVRWGGDEFLVLFEQVEDEAAALELVQRVLTAVAEPIGHLNQVFVVTASLGVVFCAAADTVDPDELVRRADAAMYRSKRIGRNAFAVFDSLCDPAL
jgi:diguanylate cyclase (GGDEF)-like protein